MASRGKIIGIDRGRITVESGTVRIVATYREGFTIGQEVEINGNQVYPAKKQISFGVVYDSAVSNPPYRFIICGLEESKAMLVHALLAKHEIKADTIDFVVHKGPFTYFDGEPSSGPDRFYTSRNQIPVRLDDILHGETDTSPVQFFPVSTKSLFDDMWDNPRRMRHIASWYM